MKEATMGRLQSDLKLSELIRLGPLRLALTLCCWAILTGLAASCPAPDPHSQPQVPEAGAASPRVVITFEGGLLSISAHTAPWAEVLQEIERHTGISTRVQGRLTGTATGEFGALPLEQALRHLFRHVDHVFFYTPVRNDGTVAETFRCVWLFPRDDNAAQIGAQPPLAPSFGRQASTHHETLSSEE
jgi:hypothetical protein